MASLEYRLLDSGNHYPILYTYRSIAEWEINLRFACDYFVKGTSVYEVRSCAVNPDCFVIYVSTAPDEQASFPGEAPGGTDYMTLEVRQFMPNTQDCPLIHSFSFHNHHVLLLHLQSSYLTLLGREWQKTACEIDENRGVYVYYCCPSQEEEQ